MRLAVWLELEPIASWGSRDTNYFATTERGRYLLTLYERLPAGELPFYLNLMAHLARAGVEVPAPVPDRTGACSRCSTASPRAWSRASMAQRCRHRCKCIARMWAQRWRDCTSRRRRIVHG
jgi:hypothetical protein